MKSDYTLDHEWERYGDYPRVSLSPFASHLLDNDLLALFIKLARYKFATRLIQPNSTVVDLGCGDGLGSLFLSQHSKKTIGVDIHRASTDYCRANYNRPNLEFVRSSGEDFRAEEPVDAVVCLDTVEHVPQDVAPRLIGNIGRILKPSGILILGTPSIYSQPYASPNRIAQHYIEYTREKLEHLVAPFFARTLFFSMNDELVHTGFDRLAWYLLLICSSPTASRQNDGQ